MDKKIGNANESTVAQISPYPEDDMLGIEPLELHFPVELNTQISCSVELSNETNVFFAFSIQTTSPLPYCIQPNKDIVAPRSKYSVNITLQPLDHAPQDRQYTGDFIVRSTKVSESLISEDITEDMFNREDGKLVDEVNLMINYKAGVPQVDVSLGSLLISDMRNLQISQESSVSPTEADSKISASTSDEVIQFDPPELYFPLVPDKKVISSVKIINITEFYICLNLTFPYQNTGIYNSQDAVSIIPPRSTEWLTVKRYGRKDAVKDMQFNDRMHVWYAIVAEGIKRSDLDRDDFIERKILPIILTEASPCTSNDLIQFDPPALSLSFMPNKRVVFSVNIVNNTDYYVGFDKYQPRSNECWFYIEPPGGVLPPRSTQRLVVKRTPEKTEYEDMQCKDRLLLWSNIVTEGVQASEFKPYVRYDESKELPIEYKASPCTSNELIQFDPPALSLPFMPNKPLVFSVNVVNTTDYYVGFDKYEPKSNVCRFSIEPPGGVMPPRCTQRLVVKRIAEKKECEDMQCKDRFLLWSSVVSEGVQAIDLKPHLDYQGSKELPIVYKRTSSTVVELIKFEPPEVCFPFLPRKRLLSSFKITNTTDYHIGFNTHAEGTNMALYITEPPCGVLPPRSTQELAITRVTKEEAPELEDMQCKDKYFVWSCLVTEDVNARDLTSYMPKTERKELPVVFTETSSNKLIQFDPPEVCLPLLPNQRVLSSAKIVNITDQYIGYRICNMKSNSARYNINPSEGILPPLSTQVLLVTSVAHENELVDTQCKHKFVVWNGIVTKDVKASDVIDNMTDTKCTELSIVLTKTGSSTSDELIQFDPPELHFPFLPNKKVLSSFKIVNVTDYNVGFNTYSNPKNAAWYHTEPPRGILPPRSTQKLLVTREYKEDALTEDKQLDDKYFVGKIIVCEGVKESDLSDCMADQESKELPIILYKISSSTSDELIQLDPAEVCVVPLCVNKLMNFKVDVVNATDFYVAFNAYWLSRKTPLHTKSAIKTGILPPRSTKPVILSWVTREYELEDMEPSGDYFVWSRVVTQTIESGDIISYMDEEESKHLPIILSKTSPCTSNELIQFDPPELSLPFMPNKPLVFSVNIVNNTDYHVGFNKLVPKANTGWYDVEPVGGVMRPRSTQRLVVKRTPNKKEEEDMQCQDKFYIWNSFVSEGVEASDIVGHVGFKYSKELPIGYSTKKTSLCVSDELIQFDPPQLPFPFMPNSRVSMLRFFNIVNVTDHNVGFTIWKSKENSAKYITEPEEGILPPQSTQAIKVRRTLKEKVEEDMQCKDKITVWSGIVTEGIEASDVRQFYRSDENKVLPVVLTKAGESSAM